MIYLLWVTTLTACAVFLNTSLDGADGYSYPILLHFVLAFLKSGAAVPGSIWIAYGFMAKLTVSWFFIVWLRLNLMRLRFDQVASYTWHELVLYCIFLLIEIVVAVWLF